MCVWFLALAACLSSAAEPEVEINVDATSLLQVSLRNNERSHMAVRQVPAQDGMPMQPETIEGTEDSPGNANWNGKCDVTFKNGQDCAAFKTVDMYRKLSDWSWQSRLCKVHWWQSVSAYGRQTDHCLWQGCVANKNLRQGAEWYMLYKNNEEDTAYCFKEHCGNKDFTLDGTTLKDADAYCTKKFGDKWSNLLAGPHGLGWPGEGPGSGLWECAHNNYHCDWAYCKMYFCDDLQLRAKWCNSETGVNCSH